MGSSPFPVRPSSPFPVRPSPAFPVRPSPPFPVRPSSPFPVRPSPPFLMPANSARMVTQTPRARPDHQEMSQQLPESCNELQRFYQLVASQRLPRHSVERIIAGLHQELDLPVAEPRSSFHRRFGNPDGSLPSGLRYLSCTDIQQW